MRSRSRVLIPLALASAAVGAGHLPVHAATCVSDPASLAAADVVFVGTLTSISTTADQGTLAVDEVWSAGDLPPVVVVTGFPGQWNGYALASRYLVLASVIDGKLRFGDRECNIAMSWDESFAAIRPAIAHPPRPSDEKGGPPLQLLVAAGAMLAIGLVSLYAFRRPRPEANERSDG